MVNAKQKFPFKWLGVILFFIVIVYWPYRYAQNAVRPVVSKDLGAGMALDQGLQGGLSGDRSGLAAAVASQAGKINEWGKQKAKAAQVADTSEGQAVTSFPVSGGAVQEENIMPSDPLAPAGVANFIPTQAQIVSSIELQNQRRQALAASLADRTAQINKVHEAVLYSPRSQDPAGEGEPVAPPLLTPPSRIVQGLQSHELVGH